MTWDRNSVFDFAILARDARWSTTQRLVRLRELAEQVAHDRNREVVLSRDVDRACEFLRGEMEMEKETTP